MHCSANQGRCEHGGRDDVTLFFGLSGTGKTTLSADPQRLLIGDDEHCWSDEGIFNIEGGCYAKVIHLTAESEPEIFNAIRFGAVLENVVYDPGTHHVNYDDASITENTRVAYPIEFIPRAKIPCVGGHPKNIIFLTCDAFGVLPPVSKLTADQAMYHFISGYTAKVAGTEMGVTEPSATFSTCFGAAFHGLASIQVRRVAEREDRQTSERHVWLVNTGWTGGSYGTGKRMSLAGTRAIIDAIHSGASGSSDDRRRLQLWFGSATACPHVDVQFCSLRKLGKISRSIKPLLANWLSFFIRILSNLLSKAAQRSERPDR